MAGMIFTVGVDPTKAQTGLDGISKKFDELSDNAKKQTDGINSILSRITARDAIEGIDKGVAAFRNLATQLKETNPEVSKFLGQVSDIGDSVTKFSKLGMAFGPEGAIVGGIVGALIPAAQLLKEKMDADSKALDDFRAASDRSANQLRQTAIPALQTYIDHLIALKTQQAQQEEMENRLRSGQGILIEYEAANTRAMETKERVQQRLNQLDQEALYLAGRRNLSDDDARDNAHQLAIVEHALAEQRTQLQIVTQNATEAQNLLNQAREREGTHTGTIIEETGTLQQTDPNASARQSRAREAAEAGRAQLRAEAAARREAEMDQWAQEESDYRAFVAAQTRIHEQSIIAEQARERNNLSIRHEMRLRDQMQAEEMLMRAAQARDKAAEQEKAAQIQRNKENEDIIKGPAHLAEQAGQQMASAIGGAVVAAIEGKKSFSEAMKEMARATLESLTQQAVTQAIWETAQGIAQLAIFIGSMGANASAAASSAAHFTAAGTYAAIGGAAGAGLAAMGSSGTGATSGGNSSSGPQSQQSNQSNSSGPTNIVVNINGGFGTSSEIGRAVYQSLQTGMRQGSVPSGAVK